MNIDIRKTCMVTGHRPPRIGGYNALAPMRQKIRAALRRSVRYAVALGYDTFISGMALGVDQDFAEVMLELKDHCRLPLRLIAAVPCEGQEQPWPPGSQRKYKSLLERADYVEYVNRGAYAGWKMQARNIWMADRSGLVVAVFDGLREGGTWRCVEYAQTLGSRFIYINPDALMDATFIPEVSNVQAALA